MKHRILVALAALTVALAGPVRAKETVGNVVDDATVTATVMAAFLDNKNTHATELHVETYRGIVQLSGFVTSQAEKDEAGRIAEGISGVKEVRNSVAVHAGTSVGTKLDDTLLTGKVKAALLDAADVKSTDVRVVSQGGIVQLAGFVASQDMKDRAARVADGVSGVKELDNELIVRPS